MPGNFHTITFAEVATWPKPNYIDPPDQRTWLPPYSIAWTVLASFFVFGRLYLRVRHKSGTFGLDDVCIVISYGFSVAFTAAACVSVWYYDIGRHIWDMRPDSVESALYWGWIAQVLFIFSTGACKISVLLFYRRMAKNTFSKGWMYGIWILMFITIGAWFGVFVAYCKMCTPLTAYWRVYKMEAVGDNNYTCLNGGGITIAAGVVTIASDFWTAALPCAMFQVYDLGVSKRQKIALNIIFCLGFLVTGVGISRTYYLWTMSYAMDISWIGYDLFATSMTEAQLGIVLCCAPFCRALFRRFLPDVTHRSQGESRQNASVADKDARWSSNGIQFQPVSASHNSYMPSSSQAESQFESRGEKKGFLINEEPQPRSVWDSAPPKQSPYDPLQRDYYNKSPQSSYNASPHVTYDSPPMTPYESPVSPQKTWQNHSYPIPKR